MEILKINQWMEVLQKSFFLLPFLGSSECFHRYLLSNIWSNNFSLIFFVPMIWHWNKSKWTNKHSYCYRTLPHLIPFHQEIEKWMPSITMSINSTMNDCESFTRKNSRNDYKSLSFNWFMMVTTIFLFFLTFSFSFSILCAVN